MEDRNKLAGEIQSIGRCLTDLRDILAKEDYGFCCGLVRAAEEALVVVYTSLTDASVGEEQL